MGAISPGARPAIRTQSSFPNSCCSKRRSPPLSRIITTGSRRFPDFGSLARASENEVLHAWQGLGYYARARNLHATAKTVMDRHGGNFPRGIEQMRQLSGVGKYTAHAVASFAFNQSVPIVEANTGRVVARLFNLRQSIDSNPGRRMVWQHAASLLPKSDAATFNSALLDLGALICVARKPKCNVCAVKDFCRAKNPAVLPIRKSRLETKRLIEAYALIVRGGRILLEQSRHRWRGMWILPPLGPGCLEQPDFQRQPSVRVRVSIHPSSNQAFGVSSRRATPNRPWTAVVWVDGRSSNAFTAPARARRPHTEQRCFLSAAEQPKVPATVVRIVMGMPNRA